MPWGNRFEAADGQDLVADLGRNPGVDAVADDVIEPAEVLRSVEDAHRVQLDVGEALGPEPLPPGRDLPRREVDADEVRSGETLGHRDQVAAAGAPELQDSA